MKFDTSESGLVYKAYVVFLCQFDPSKFRSLWPMFHGVVILHFQDKERGIKDHDTL